MTDYEYMRQKYASLEAQYFALVKAIADGLALQSPPRFVVSKDFTMPVEVAGSLEPGAMQMLVPSESVQFPAMVPIDMVLHCPKCHLQHIDAPEPAPLTEPLPYAGTMMRMYAGSAWDNPPHRSHKCSGCGHIWRPADVCTNGVAAVKTVGKNDSPLEPGTLLTWACARWREEVQNRPLENNNRRPLDDVWRQVVRYAGGSPDDLLGPAHDDLVAKEKDDWRRGLHAGDVLGGGY